MRKLPTQILLQSSFGNNESSLSKKDCAQNKTKSERLVKFLRSITHWRFINIYPTDKNRSRLSCSNFIYLPMTVLASPIFRMYTWARVASLLTHRRGLFINISPNSKHVFRLFSRYLHPIPLYRNCWRKEIIRFIWEERKWVWIFGTVHESLSFMFFSESMACDGIVVYYTILSDDFRQLFKMVLLSYFVENT